MSNFTRSIFSKQVIIGSFLLAILLCCLVLVFQVGIFPYVGLGTEQKAVVVITPIPEDEIEKSDSDHTSPTETSQSLPGVIALGNTVIVSGTGQDGLRMRAAAGTDQGVLQLAEEGEILTIIDGPIIKDSLIWWKLQSNHDNSKIGWSVQDYLQIYE